MVQPRAFISSVCCVLGTGVIFGQRANAQNIVVLDNSSTAAAISSGQADVRLSASSQASSNHQSGWARFASNSGNLAFLAAGTLLPLVEDGKAGKEHSLRIADSLLTSALITEGLKTLTHEKRPDGSDYKSFPSGHATAAFAVASMQAHYHPHQALLWYGGAAIIAASRVDLRRHHFHDVVAGAAVGYLTTKIELKQRRGLLLSPFISSSRGDHTGGLSLEGAF